MSRPREMLARTAMQPRVLVALIQCATMATGVVEVATKGEEDVRFRYFGVFLRGFAVFGPPLRPPQVCSPLSELSVTGLFGVQFCTVTTGYSVWSSSGPLSVTHCLYQPHIAENGTGTHTRTER